jgi:general secretion pathway protein D
VPRKHRWFPTVTITADKATNSLIITADRGDYATLVEIIRQIDIPRSMVYIEALIMEVNADKSFDLGTEWVVGDDVEFSGREGIVGGGFTTG